MEPCRPAKLWAFSCQKAQARLCKFALAFPVAEARITGTMGKKRGSHFSKKNSTTFSLVHSSTDDGSDPQRIWVDKSKGVGIGRPDPDRVESQQHEAMLQGRRPPGHPLSFLDAETASYSLSEDQRREIIGLGLPDDGYDYLKHLRALDRAAATSQDEGKLPVSCAPSVTSPGPFTVLTSQLHWQRHQSMACTSLWPSLRHLRKMFRCSTPGTSAFRSAPRTR